MHLIGINFTLAKHMNILQLLILVNNMAKNICTESYVFETICSK